jgi:four helix bundle protein
MQLSSLLEHMGSHRNLIAWQEAMKLVAAVYRETANYPKDERFGLVAQTRRAAVSVPANIAEGAGRNTSKELAHFLGFATGSLAEVETEIELAVMLDYLPQTPEIMGQVRRVGRLLTALRASVKSEA